MCKFLVVKLISEGGGNTEVITGAESAADAFKQAEQIILKTDTPLEVYERISTGCVTKAVKWEGRRRPGAAT